MKPGDIVSYKYLCLKKVLEQKDIDNGYATFHRGQTKTYIPLHLLKVHTLKGGEMNGK